MTQILATNHVVAATRYRVTAQGRHAIVIASARLARADNRSIV